MTAALAMLRFVIALAMLASETTWVGAESSWRTAVSHHLLVPVGVNAANVTETAISFFTWAPFTPSSVLEVDIISTCFQVCLILPIRRNVLEVVWVSTVSSSGGGSVSVSVKVGGLLSEEAWRKEKN